MPWRLLVAWPVLQLMKLAARILWPIASPGYQCDFCEHQAHVHTLKLCGKVERRPPGPDRLPTCKLSNRWNRCRWFEWSR